MAETRTSFTVYAARTLLPVLMLGLAIFAYNRLKASRPEIVKHQQKEKVWAVRTITANVRDIRPTLRLFGETMAGRKVELRAHVPGKVIALSPNLRQGGIVRRGDVLLEVDKFIYVGAVTEAGAGLLEARAKQTELIQTLVQEKAALVRAREQLEIGQKDLERALQLVKKRSLSKQSTDARRLIVSQRQAQVEQHDGTIKVMNARLAGQQAAITRAQWNLASATRNLEDTELKAPFNAYVSGVNADVGRLLNVNDQVATLLDKDWLEVRFSLSDRQYGRIIADGEGIIGRKARIRWHIGDRPVAVNARIERINAEFSMEEGGVQVFARIISTGETARAMRSGAFVEVLLPDKLYQNAVRLPQTALYNAVDVSSAKTRSNVFVVGKDNRLAERAVTKVGVDGTHILVNGDLKSGDQVVTTRLSNAGTGLKVREIGAKKPTEQNARQAKKKRVTGNSG